MIIDLLHTAESNAAIFDAIKPEGAILRHRFRADLLNRALALGAADREILDETAAELNAMPGAARLLTCTTLAPAAAAGGAIRVDEALAEAAAQSGEDVEVFVTLPSTVGPTREIFESKASATGAGVTVTMIDGAADAFTAGDAERYLSLIAEAAGASVAPVAALAQVSMAPATAQIARPVLTSPATGLAAVMKVAAN